MRKHIFISFLMTAVALLTFSASAQQTREEVTDSLKTIIEAAKGGDAKAQNEIGMWYYTGRHYKQDYKEAAKWWAKSAKQDYVPAIGNLGMCYQKGRGVEADSLRAVQLYITSIKKGNKELLEQNAQLAKKGDVFSAMLVATCYVNGFGLKKDAQKAVPYLKIAADKGCEPAKETLVKLLFNDKKYAEAAPLMKKLAEKGNTECAYYYGAMLLNGMGIKQDKKEGADFLLKAAEGGNAKAMYEVALCYTTGNGLTMNADQALVWYKKAAGKGIRDAQWDLATCYREGKGTDINYDQAMHWYAQAVSKGYSDRFRKLIADTIPQSPFIAYLKGMKDYYNNQFQDALKQFKVVKKAKIQDGNLMEAAILVNKDYAKQNIKKGIKELTKAAETNPQAMYFLGSLYERGKGVDADMEKAVEYLTKAAELGYGRAQCALADMYYEGRGVEKNIQTAAKYYQEAYSQGQLNENAAKRYITCYKDINGEEADDAVADEILKSVEKTRVGMLLQLI